jgi:redox-sensitive bicupin YhaK (pirin superfamily)
MTWSPVPDPVPGNAESVDAIDTLIVPRAVDLGEMTVRRALPTTQRQMVGPFIFFDEMGPAEFLTNEGIDVRPHPHINLATITYLFEGQIVHKDSLGTDKTITPGAVNWMSAGRGIVHSERTSTERRQQGQRLSGLQTWVALPQALEESDPAFIHHAADELPELAADGVQARIIAGSAFGERSPLKTASETLYAELIMDNGSRVQLDADVDERAIYVLSGGIRIGRDEFEAHQLVVLKRGIPLVIEARQSTRLMVFGGEPMSEPRYIWWNFVSSRLDRIEAAKDEWRQGQFDTVPGDVEEFIPLPENAGKPRLATGSANSATDA